MGTVLTYEEAKEIYETISSHVDRTDEDIVGLYNDHDCPGSKVCQYPGRMELLFQGTEDGTRPVTINGP